MPRGTIMMPSHPAQALPTGNRSLTGLTDHELVDRFVMTEGPGADRAFEVLLARHGSMVWAVCRHLLRNPHDASDAFQATFLVLVRRAGSIRVDGSLGGWLYGVACRTALEARAARRRVLEHPVSAVPELAAPLPPDNNTDQRRVIDEELANRRFERVRGVLIPIIGDQD